MRKILFSSLFILALIAFAGHAAADTPEARTEALIQTFKAVHSSAPGAPLTAAQLTENQESYKALDAAFDLDAFVDATIANVKDKFSAEELATFQSTFKALVQAIAYPDSGAFLREASSTMSVVSASPSEDQVKLALYLEEEDLEVDVTFVWRPDAAGVSRVQDVLFDGDSLVLEYQNQFSKIVQKDGVAGLLEKLEAKKKEMGL